jgi:futalosine hydrolase
VSIYIVAATALEIAPTLAYCEAHFKKIGATCFEIGNNKIFLEVHGVGVPLAMYHIHKYCLQQPTLIVQIGIAGTFNKEIGLGNVYVIGADRFADIGAQDNDNFVDVFEMGLIKENETPFMYGNLFNTEKPYPAFFTGLQPVNAITVNTVSGDANTIAMLQNKYKPTLESMEGAALHYTCLQEKIAFVQMRAVSNYVTVRDKSSWKIKEAVANVNEYLIHYLKTLQID